MRSTRVKLDDERAHTRWQILCHSRRVLCFFFFAFTFSRLRAQIPTLLLFVRASRRGKTLSSRRASSFRNRHTIAGDAQFTIRSARAPWNTKSMTFVSYPSVRALRARWHLSLETSWFSLVLLVSARVCPLLVVVLIFLHRFLRAPPRLSHYCCEVVGHALPEHVPPLAFDRWRDLRCWCCFAVIAIRALSRRHQKCTFQISEIGNEWSSDSRGRRWCHLRRRSLLCFCRRISFQSLGPNERIAGLPTTCTLFCFSLFEKQSGKLLPIFASRAKCLTPCGAIIIFFFSFFPLSFR